ncbi:MAG TPA: tRNA (adenosine(37)-N6)-threonylcarbamoyltransferase complex ATPase subunit type 1 TsaE, partial [bacterium]|nr:tRNA (adenosine(37)-N6)-threonylcarbamoyltransferase complex ATPase subunit type 1 TsaE [bacterium]
FTILNQYQTDRFLLNHLDLYRMQTFDELEHIDLLSCFEDPGAITFVEWADKFDELRSEYTKLVHFEYIDGEALKRKITCHDC